VVRIIAEHLCRYHDRDVDPAHLERVAALVAVITELIDHVITLRLSA